MSQALETWRKKLDYLQQQEAIVADPVQKFALAEQLKEVQVKIAELEAMLKTVGSKAPGETPPALSGTESTTPARQPRVYISYTWRTKGLKRRALKLAEKLHKAGIDTRHDLFYAKSLHGFTPPDPLAGRDSWEAWQEEQIRDADWVLVVCTPEYFGSPPSSGAWRDLDFMQEDLTSGRAKARKFIPVGFGSYENIKSFVPAFIKGANYYDLSARAVDGFGLEDLIRRLKTDLANSGKGTQQTGQAPAPSTQTGSPMNSPKSERSVVWLHLSDLHNCKSRTGWDAHRVLKPLLKDLQKMETDHGLAPQILFFTGDAAFGNIGNVAGSTLQEQFDGAHQLLEGARAAFSRAIPHENVFIVPGNHDVDREEITDDQTDWLAKQTDPATVRGLIQKAKKQWQKYLDRLAAYREFLTRCNYQHLLSDPKRLIYSQIRDLHGLKLGIAGFNSAWTCGEHDKKGSLWFGGDWQAGELVNQLGDADLRVALIHHPFGWFVDQEDTSLRILFEREFGFHLHGHEHLGWVDAKADGHVRVAAAACYDRSHLENGYNFVRLNLDTGEGEVWLRKYDAHGGGWVPRVVAGKTNNDGLWRLGKLPCLQATIGKAKPVNP